MEVMEDITITMSSKLHNLLKNNGMKGETYEHIILRLVRQEFSQDYRKFQDSGTKKGQKPSVQAILKKPVKEPKPAVAKLAKTIVKKLEKPAKKMQAKVNVAKITKHVQKAQKPKIEEKLPIKPKNAPVNKELKQWAYEKNLELQGLKTDLELAKLYNDADKINEITLRLAKLKQELVR